ncbi:MAG: ABC transporter permease [Lachnospiraceae bacterium]|nr:ABC transporter permease [Lachnospiraceae bacterium]
MKGFFAAFYKDLRLMCNRTGLLTLVLSALMIPLFLWGMRDLDTERFVQPFPLAVRDLDETVMSRSLIAQIGELELFSEIRRLDEYTTEEGALSAGAAAVLTIPKDFFYEMYTGSDCPAVVTLNDAQPLQAALVKTVITSVMDIVIADQCAWRGLYEVVYGAEAEAHMEELYEGASAEIFSDALSRQRVFREEIIPSDAAARMRRKLAAVLMPMLSLLFCLAALRTVRQEQRMGALLRFRSLGRSLLSFLLSKFLIAAAFTAAVFVPLYVLADTGRAGLFVLLALLVFAASFAVIALLTALTGDDSAAGRWCNVYLLLSLFFGDVLLPAGTLPKVLEPLQQAAIPHHVFPVLNALYDKYPAADVLQRMLPLAMLTAGCVLAALLLTPLAMTLRKGASSRGGHAAGKAGGGRAQMPGKQRRRLLPFVWIGGMKWRLYTGGFIAFLAVILLSFAAGLAVRDAGSGGEKVSIALVDLDGSADAAELTKLLKEKTSESLLLYETDEAGGAKLMMDGTVEGLFTIGEGYAVAVQTEALLPLTYKATQSAFTAQGVREIIAGQVATQRAWYRALARYEDMRGTAADTAVEASLKEAVERAKETLPAVYHLDTRSGQPQKEPFTPETISFFALLLILMLMTFAAYTGRTDARKASQRLSAVSYGRHLSFGADVLAVFLAGLLCALAFFAPFGAPPLWRVPVVLLLILNVTMLSLLLTNITVRTGRVDALAPLATLLICLAGGCFLDLSGIASSLTAFMTASPAGAALFAERGSVPALAVLLGETALFALLVFPRKR